MSEVTCFWTEPTDKVRLYLRRFNFSGDKYPVRPPCADGDTYHSAMNDFGVHPAKYCIDKGDGATYLESRESDGPPHDDPRWPTKCEKCSYVFQPEDQWQVFQDQIYKRVDNGEEFNLRDAPVGAMYDAKWYGEKGFDGVSLMVVLPPSGGPANIWHVDGFAKGGGKWTRTGTIPNVTAMPSILTPRYHGFLVNGVLRSC